MKRRAALALGFGTLAAAAPAAPPRSGFNPNSYANPSAVIATELAFAKEAQDKGQWTAFAEYAAPDAVMFTPQMVWAQTWLKGRANPPVAVKWQPHAAWSSCDGSLVVTHGAWQRPGAVGYFTTIWRRQPDGKYKYVLDHGDALAAPLEAPEMLSALVADCPPGKRKPPAKQSKIKFKDLPPLDPARRSGQSDDGSLSWEVTVAPDGARNLKIEWAKDGARQLAVIEDVAAEGK